MMKKMMQLKGQQQEKTSSSSPFLGQVLAPGYFAAAVVLLYKLESFIFVVLLRQ
jgi:hypothetical protein